jgi:hypothetical protein
MHRRVNPPASQWQTTGRQTASRPRSAGLAQSLRERIRRGEIPESIQDLIGPVKEKHIDTAIEVLETLKGKSATFEDLSPAEKRAFAKAYLERTGGRRSGLGGGVLVLGALAIVGGVVWWQSTRGRQAKPSPPPPPPEEAEESDDDQKEA